MLEVQVALDGQKDEFQTHEENVQKREDEMKKKNKEFQESLIKFNRFLQVSWSKHLTCDQRSIVANLN